MSDHTRRARRPRTVLWVCSTIMHVQYIAHTSLSGTILYVWPVWSICSGECRGLHTPGDGSGCTWKRSRIQKVVNASCVQHAVYSNIEARNQPCFARCAQASSDVAATRPAKRFGATPNRSSPCVNSCFQAAVIGTVPMDGVDTSSRWIPPMTAAEILAPWARAFASAPGEGVCPPCVRNTATGVYSCPTKW